MAQLAIIIELKQILINIINQTTNKGKVGLMYMDLYNNKISLLEKTAEDEQSEITSNVTSFFKKMKKICPSLNELDEMGSEPNLDPEFLKNQWITYNEICSSFSNLDIEVLSTFYELLKLIDGGF